MLNETCNFLVSDEKTAYGHVSTRLDALQEAAHLLMTEMAYHPANGVHDCHRNVEHPDTVTQEEFEHWKAGLEVLGPYRGIAVYLMTDYQARYAKPIPIHILFNLFLGKNIFPLHKNPYRDEQDPQKIFLPESDAMRQLARKFNEINLVLHVVWQAENPAEMQGYVILELNDYLDHYPKQRKERVEGSKP